MELGVSYFGNRILKHFLADLEDIKAHHCTYIVHTFSENDHTFYKETMRDIVQATKDAGLKAWVDPWGVGRVFGGEAFSNFTANNPDSLQMANDDILTPCACPNAPKFREFMAQWIEDAKWIGADMLFWDEPHFYMPTWIGGRPGTWACKCKFCQAKWDEMHPGKPFPTERTEEFLKARDAWLLDFLRFLTDKTHEVGLPSSLCLLPVNAGHPEAAENWEAFASLPNVSDIGTDPYWMALSQGQTLENFVRPQTQKIMELAKKLKKDAHMWLQGFKIEKGREEEMAQAVEIFAEEGCRNIATWGFQCCGHISYIAPDDPAKCWETVGKAYAKVKDL